MGVRVTMLWIKFFGDDLGNNNPKDEDYNVERKGGRVRKIDFIEYSKRHGTKP